MNGLDLFSGIGGIGLALSEFGVRTVAYCEQDRYAQGVLLSRMQSGEIDRAPIWDDIRTLSKELLPQIDIIFGGFPCQDISVAGLGNGLAGERSGLFYEIIRLTKEIRPDFVFLENVPAIRTRGLEQVVKAFTEIGYDCRWTCISAASIGAPHKRERWFLLAHANSVCVWDRREWSQKRKAETDSITQHNGTKESLADSMLSGLERQRKKSRRVETEQHHACDDSWWAIEPNVGRVVNGLPMRMDRIKCLGNSVVPLQVKTAFNLLIGNNANETRFHCR